MIGRCQVCGRRARPRADGTIARHYVNGEPCEGEGALPLELDDGRLAALAADAETRLETARRELRELEQRRANWIDPALVRERDRLATLAPRLQRRLDRLRAWPARFARQMERDGYGDRPPEYLAQRAERERELGDIRDPAVARVMRETGMAELQAIRHLRDRRELQRRGAGKFKGGCHP